MTKTLFNFAKQEFWTGYTEHTGDLRVGSALQNLKGQGVLKLTYVSSSYI